MNPPQGARLSGISAMQFATEWLGLLQAVTARHVPAVSVI